MVTQKPEKKEHVSLDSRQESHSQLSPQPTTSLENQLDEVEALKQTKSLDQNNYGLIGTTRTPTSVKEIWTQVGKK